MLPTETRNSNKSRQVGSAALNARNSYVRTSDRPTIAVAATTFAQYFHELGRSFPWRSVRDPYKIGIAEILLQKTRAASALPIFDRLVNDYPKPEDLGSAVIERIADLVRPIGLSMKRAHQLRGYGAILSQTGIQSLADWRWSLLELPGLGAYGARAVACFGFGEKLGLVDANVTRVTRRIFGLRQADPRATIFQRYADALAAQSQDASAMNYGILDLAAKLCTPNPRCPECPLARLCKHAIDNNLSSFRVRPSYCLGIEES